MGDIRVRGVEKGVVGLLKAQAERAGKSWQEFLNDTLQDVAMRPRRELAARLRERHETMRAEFGVLPDSTLGIRAERDGLDQ
jgi:hypothetical protein